MKLSQAHFRQLEEALTASSYSYCSGTTHGFYHYPARFSPDVARSAIEVFTSPGDVVMDPFMGGGTTIIEGLCLGRQMIGVDLNALAHFVTDVRTTPLSANDAVTLMAWANQSVEECSGGALLRVGERVANLPASIERVVARALALTEDLPFPRQRAFARCALLRLGQVTLDCRDVVPRRRQLAARLSSLVQDMLSGLDELVEECRASSLPKNQIVGSRLLLHRSAVGLHSDQNVLEREPRPRLVLTSPPYMGVHVLYHRWQYRGRKETAAPYWIAGIPDGFHESHYTGGSRTPTGHRRYLDMIERAFRSVTSVLAPDGLIVQLVGFSDTASQLPSYLRALERAGLKEVAVTRSGRRLRRRVPNRKWYAKLRGHGDASSEILLLHRPSRLRSF